MAASGTGNVVRLAKAAAPGEDVQDLKAALARARRTERLLRRTIARQAEQLQAKSDLLTEVNHRAKNSLQMAMALLSMQALAAEDGRVASALQAAAERLGYLARVHELLYQRGDDIQEIDIGGFLRDIGDALEEAFKRKDVKLRYDVPALKLDVGRGTSVALIVGEAVLNAYKYAFPAGAGGTIEIVCGQEGGIVSLAVRDDGTGFPAEQRRGSLGMRLLRALGRALGGETSVTSGDGTEVAVSFPLAPPQG
ncbi:MAG TPA: sensor histidine kinase [Allosphingosinicella sp.]|nr:sensor histidine kinase [Allosphingosinicella sp.]